MIIYAYYTKYSYNLDAIYFSNLGYPKDIGFNNEDYRFILIKNTHIGWIL